MRKLALLLPLCLAALACAKTGFGSGLRPDVIAQMESARNPIATCYEQALTRNRKLQGTIQLSFEAAPKTGQFTNVNVTRDDLGDKDLTQCVVQQVSTLKLSKPTSTKIAIDYPIQ